jgi:hypothetical protein
MLTLELCNKWHKIRLHLARSDLDLDDTNNATERASAGAGCATSRCGLQEHRGMENGIAIDPIALQRGRRARLGEGDSSLSWTERFTENKFSNSSTVRGTVTLTSSS